jgi:light-regulated signal transduction histidine kinase (bacteriophytochrome)
MRLFQESVDQDVAEPINYVFNSLSLPMMELADDLLSRTAKLDPNEERVIEDLMRGLLELRRRNLQRNLHQNIEYIRYLMQEAGEQGDTKATSYLQMMVQHTETMRRLNIAVGRYTGRSLPTRQGGG